MKLTKRDLFAAAECGDIETLDRYFAQPEARAAALEAEETISYDEFPVLAFRLRREAAIPEDAWVFLNGSRARNIFDTVAQCHQPDIMKWFFTSPFVDLVPKTLQFFLVDAAAYAVYWSDIEMLEILLTSPVFTDSPIFSEATGQNIFPRLVSKAIECECISSLAVLTAHRADLQRVGISTPVGEAARHGSTGAVVQSVIRDGAPVVGDQEAVENGVVEVLCVVLENGADPRAKNGFDQTPLHTAADGELPQMADTLLKAACVDIDARNRGRWA